MKGRPPKYNNPENLQKKIDEYLEILTIEKKNPTISGLVYHCGFADRRSFYDLEQRPDYSYTVKRARLFIESFYESKLLSPGSATGAIFALKNFGWRDQQEINIGNVDIDPKEWVKSK